MSSETELKLSLPAEQVPLLKESAFWQTRCNAEPQTFHLGNTYFDTVDRRLNQAKVALRIREKNGQYYQTLKTRGESINGLTHRGEWEWPIPTAVLDSTGLEKIWPEALADVDVDDLEPLFATDFTRTCWYLNWLSPAARVEAALDVGVVKAGDDSAPICELELELLEGDEAALLSIAARLSQDFALQPSDKSKAERGFELLRQR